MAFDIAPEVAETEGGTPPAALPMAPASAPASAPAKAFSSSVIAADTGSAAECLVADALNGSSVLAVVLPLEAAVLAGVASVGAAASD
ncbi:MAG TPA: hypothetical protein VFX20_01780 [Steroidobacteraceae bacterium]|nr:hypothetical protein [Steroidobacteraceae bacterium]